MPRDFDYSLRRTKLEFIARLSGGFRELRRWRRRVHRLGKMDGSSHRGGAVSTDVLQNYISKFYLLLTKGACFLFLLPVLGYIVSANSASPSWSVRFGITDYCFVLAVVCDPVLGDEGKLYVLPELVAVYREMACVPSHVVIAYGALLFMFPLIDFMKWRYCSD